MTPHIHANGTPGARLKSQYMAATHALAKALVAVQEIELNERDYYPLGDNAWQVAKNARENVLNAIEAQWKALGKVAEKITEQMERGER